MDFGQRAALLGGRSMTGTPAQIEYHAVRPRMRRYPLLGDQARDASLVAYECLANFELQPSRSSPLTSHVCPVAHNLPADSEIP